MKKLISVILIICFLFGAWFVYSEIYAAEAQKDIDKITFEVKSDENVSNLANRLESEHVIRSVWFFKKYLALLYYYIKAEIKLLHLWRL